MEKEIHYKNSKYWVKIEGVIILSSGLSGYIVYINNEKPGGLYYGETIKDEQKRTIVFNTPEKALKVTREHKEREIDNLNI